MPTKENKFPVFHFRLQQTNASLPFPFTIFSKQTEIAVLHYFG
jgi:hypothetical protein